MEWRDEAVTPEGSLNPPPPLPAPDPGSGATWSDLDARPRPRAAAAKVLRGGAVGREDVHAFPHDLAGEGPTNQRGEHKMFELDIENVKARQADYASDCYHRERFRFYFHQGRDTPPWSS